MKKKILVVDDDPKIVAALTIRLKAAGYEVSSAPGGFEGQVLRKYEPVMPALAIVPEQPE